MWQLHRESAASRAGLEPGDIIVSFDGEPIEDAAHYGRLLLDAEVGRRVTLGLLRYGDEINVDCGGGACAVTCADGQVCTDGARDCASVRSSPRTR